MEKLQALFRGHHIRQQLVFSVREEYESIVRDIESGDPTNLVYWPKESILCYPKFSSSNESSNTTSVPHQSQRKEEDEETVISISPLSSYRSSSGSDTEGVGEEEEKTIEEDKVAAGEEEEEEEEKEKEREGGGTHNTAESSDKIQKTLESAKEEEGKKELNEADKKLIEMLNYPPLLVERDSVTHDPAGLQELRWQTEMELVWLKQAISSRQQYLQLKSEFINKQKN